MFVMVPAQPGSPGQRAVKCFLCTALEYFFWFDDFYWNITLFIYC